jgi:hypothetical protein
MIYRPDRGYGFSGAGAPAPELTARLDALERRLAAMEKKIPEDQHSAGGA